MTALDEAGPASQADLGRRTTIDRSDMVATLNELGDLGLLDRAPDPTDRRRNLVSLTPAGRSATPGAVTGSASASSTCWLRSGGRASRSS
jgi:DNA-binding MarR family transcriptional regulator